MTDVHQVDLSILLGERLKTDCDKGLSSEEQSIRLQRDGPNRMTPPKSIPEWLHFLKTFTGFFSLLLLAGSVLCFIGYALKQEVENLYLGIVLFAVVFITGLFTYLQEKKSNNLMESFKNMMPDHCTVIRDGNPREVDTEDLVVGDILHLKAGDRVPADIRIIECSDDMQVDNASLTGESEPCKRSPNCTNANPLETQNMAFFGTQVPKGSCKGVVTAVGDHTFMGRIATLTLTTGSAKTPIASELDHFIYIISVVAVTLGVVFFLVGCFIGTDLITNLVFMIGIIVANVPEGLLVTVTVSLSLTAHRMSAKSVLVKNLEGVETLGSTSCICSDKTGTLTQNVMTVANVVYDDAVFDCDCSMYARPTLDETALSFTHLRRIAALCNNAKWDESSKFKKGDPTTPQPFVEEFVLGDGSTERRVMWKPIGDASESALLKFVQGSLDVDAYRVEHAKVKEIPFNSTNKYQVSVHRQPASGQLLLVMKGAPERILTRCDRCLLNGEVVPFTPALREHMESIQLELSRKGLRVLGLCELALDPAVYTPDYAFSSETPNFPLGEDRDSFPAGVPHTDAVFTKLCFVGMMALIDPPRPQVPPAVEKCKTAGIRVIMVTGDHPVTAKAIAKKVGILWGDTSEDVELRNHEKGLKEGDPGWEDPALAPAIVVPGWELTPDLPASLWDDILDHPQVVFARTSPQQKLMIVEQAQRRGEIVAVTGDGVNDAPALRKADIGIAMGIMGSAVSKEAADMILVDDNFASIVNGIEEGRLIFDNLKKSIAYTLSSNIPEIGPFLAFIVFQIPLPLETILILLIDLGTDMLPAISYAYETPEADIMKRPPRDSRQDKLVNSKLIFFAYLQIGVIQCIAAFFTFLMVMTNFGYPGHILMGLGAYENWGKQTLYCKTEGGHWFREVVREGVSSFEKWEGSVTNQHDFFSMFNQGYMFWDTEENGHLIGCHFPAKNFKGSLSSVPHFNLADPASYATSEGAFTAGNSVVTEQSIAVLLRAGYYPYLPLRGRVSPFWRRTWVEEDVAAASSVGLVGSATAVLGYQPVGAWRLSDLEEECENKSELTSRVLALILNDAEYSAMGKKLYRKASFYHSTSKAEEGYRYALTEVKEGRLVMNIASRMMQKEALHYAQTSYLVVIVIVQVADLLICKTRMLSIIDQGMSNSAMNAALFFELILASFLLYTPFLNDVLRTRPVPLTSWLMGMPYMVLIIVYDEVRKFLMRRTTTVTVNAETKQILRNAGWIERNTYY